MTRGTHLISVASDLITKGLVQAGMRKRAGDIFTRELASGIIGWVGLNRAFRKTEQLLEVNPVIGVRHQQVEERLARLLEEEFHPYVPPTISISVGYLTAEQRFRSWLFDMGTDEHAVAHSVVANITEFGYSFMTAHSTLRTITKAMEAGTGVPSDLAYRLPIAYLIMGDHAKAEKYLAKKCAEMGNGEDPYSVRYKTFALKLVEFASSANVPGINVKSLNADRSDLSD